MRPIWTLFLFIGGVFMAGALLAPWLYWSVQWSADAGPWFAEMARQPFHRFVHRAMLGLAVPGLWLLARHSGIHSWRQVGLWRSPRAGRQFACGLVIGFLSLAVVAWLALAFDARAWKSHLSPAFLGENLASAALTALAVGTLEEILFRGALFSGLRRGEQWMSALLTSSVLYALVHFFKRVEWTERITWYSGVELLGQMLGGFIEPHSLIPGFIVLLLVGIILALAYQKTGALWFSIGAHAGWIFWLKLYGALTVEHSAAWESFWGTSKLTDGWIAALVLVVPLLLLWDSTRLRSSNVRVA